jgi:hypothetical protein
VSQIEYGKSEYRYKRNSYGKTEKNGEDFLTLLETSVDISLMNHKKGHHQVSCLLKLSHCNL